jgi:hypothetical protein
METEELQLMVTYSRIGIRQMIVFNVLHCIAIAFYICIIFFKSRCSYSFHFTIMQTIEIIAMIWAMITSFWCLIAKVSGASTLGTLLIKFISLITFIWFGYKLILLIP